MVFLGFSERYVCGRRGEGGEETAKHKELEIIGFEGSFVGRPERLVSNWFICGGRE